MIECSPPTTCHISHVACHVSHVTSNMSHVTCHVSGVMCHMSHFFFGQSCEACRWRVCCQRGLHRLVSLVESFSINQCMSWILKILYNVLVPLYIVLNDVLNIKLSCTLSVYLVFLPSIPSLEFAPDFYSWSESSK